MIRCVGIAGCTPVLSALPVSVSASDLRVALLIQDGLAPLSVDRHATPEFADCNNNGRKDLIGGDSFGKTHIFIDDGTNRELDLLVGNGARQVCPQNSQEESAT